MPKLKSVLLIDDNRFDNVFHELIINELDCTEEVLSIQNPLEALEYLLSRNDHSDLMPELIFIDINMPKMNGFELLEAYNNQRVFSEKQPVIIMLTTSLNPEDKERAGGVKEIAMFANKPLDEKLLSGILAKYFSEIVNKEIPNLY